MTAADFELMPQDTGHVEPGIWIKQARVGDVTYDVPVDLVVPEGVAAAGGRRGARLGVHGKRAARRAVGLEAALIDHLPMAITVLEAGDDRTVTAAVAASPRCTSRRCTRSTTGSRAVRQAVRQGLPDLFRLMQTKPAEEVGRRLAQLANDPTAGEVTRLAVGYIEDPYGRAGRPGVEMATRALAGVVPAARIETICVSYAAALRDAVHGG